MRNRISEMTNHLAKTPGFFSVPQGNRVVSNPDQGPVCLDAVPGTHKDLAKSEVLFDVLVEGFDPDPLEVKLNHLRLGHFEIVGNKKADAVFGLGDKQQDGSDLGQMDEKLGHTKPSFFGSTNGFVFSRRLGQAAEGSFLSIDFDDTVSLGCRKENPSGLPNKIENRGTGIPGIHQYGQWAAEGLNRFGKNFDGDLDFAFESPLAASPFGPITSDGPNQPLRSHLEDTGHSTQSPDEPLGTVMNPGTFDFLAVSRTRGIVDNQQRLRGGRRLYDLLLIGFLEPVDFFGRSFQKLMQAIGVVISEDGCNLPDRSEFDESYQACQINGKVFSLGLVQGAQATAQVRRNFFRELFSHGFRVLLGLISIGDFDRKPFYLRRLSSWVT